jgi:hypothetical protein
MAIRTPRELARRLRRSASDCEHIASNLPPAHRARLLKTAGHCRMLTDDIDEPRARRSPGKPWGHPHGVAHSLFGT